MAESSTDRSRRPRERIAAREIFGKREIGGAKEEFSVEISHESVWINDGSSEARFATE